jgi:hypothetical protein
MALSQAGASAFFSAHRVLALGGQLGFLLLRLPNKADLIKPPLVLLAHYIFLPALGTNPISKFMLPFDMQCGYQAVTLARLERR